MCSVVTGKLACCWQLESPWQRTAVTGSFDAAPVLHLTKSTSNLDLACSADPFGMPAFNPANASPAELDRQIQKVDKQLLDLQVSHDIAIPRKGQRYVYQKRFTVVSVAWLLVLPGETFAQNSRLLSSGEYEIESKGSKLCPSLFNFHFKIIFCFWHQIVRKKKKLFDFFLSKLFLVVEIVNKKKRTQWQAFSFQLFYKGRSPRKLFLSSLNPAPFFQPYRLFLLLPPHTMLHVYVRCFSNFFTWTNFIVFHLKHDTNVLFCCFPCRLTSAKVWALVMILTWMTLTHLSSDLGARPWSVWRHGRLGASACAAKTTHPRANYSLCKCKFLFFVLDTAFVFAEWRWTRRMHWYLSCLNVLVVSSIADLGEIVYIVQFTLVSLCVCWHVWENLPASYAGKIAQTHAHKNAPVWIGLASSALSDSYLV